MNNKVIEAKLVLDDIRLGATDLDLMTKYKLSSEGLQSLFKKLGDLGLLKHLNASEVMQDIRSGITDRELMEKYGLSPNGLAALYVQVDRVGLPRKPVEEDTLPTKIVIHVPTIVKDIKLGVDRFELMRKYHLTPRSVRWICMKLVSSGALGWRDVVGKICSVDELVPDKLRASKRHKLGFISPVHEINNPGVVGVIRDANERGIGVRGIKARAGQVLTLVIGGDEFGEYGTFALDATCKWASREPTGEYLAGFEITNISVGSMREFQLLLQTVRLPERAKSRSTGY